MEQIDWDSDLADDRFRLVLEALPAAIYVTDQDGRVRFFNRAAEHLCGRTPRLHIDKWCVTHGLFDTDGRRLLPEDAPLARTLSQGVEIHGVELMVERPDGARCAVMPFPALVRAASGDPIGALNLLVDISELRDTQSRLARRTEEQAILYAFTDRLFRAVSDEDVYEGALDAFTAALRCDHASIQLADDQGVMRFVAWREAPRSCRTPTKEPTAAPQPLDAEQVSEASPMRSPTEAVVPLFVDGNEMGRLTAYLSEPRGLGPDEAKLATAISRQLSFCIEKRRAEAALRRSEERFRAIVDTTPECVKLVAQDGALLYMNASGLCMVGDENGEKVRGSSVYDLIAPQDQAKFRALNERVCKGERGDLAFDIVTLDGRVRHMETRAAPFRNPDGNLVHLAVTRDVSERVKAETHRALLVNELNHRVKNTLATVQSLAIQTLRNTRRSAEARERLEARLGALARAHDILTQESWDCADLCEVVRRGLDPFDVGGGRVSAAGPSVRLTPRQALAIAMGVHELATNAARFGALGTDGGSLHVSWGVSGAPTGEEMCLVWEESGGPPVSLPVRRGFGVRLMERSLQHDLGAPASVEFRPHGVVARIRAVLDPQRLAQSARWAEQAAQ